jgi:peptidoglycan/xylan/chitin deacetylase (PgdA/CDA1 family)
VGLALGGFDACGATALAPVCHGSRTRPLVALSFDACQTRKPSGYDAKIVQILKATHTPATFFLGGRWMETHPEATRQLAREPQFELGNHSYLHPHLRRVNDARLRDEITRTQAVLYELTGRRARLFRAPYGEYDARVLRTAASLGLVTVQWEVVSGDPCRQATARDLIATVTRRCRNGSIIIMHVNGRGWHTAEALPEILRRLRNAGYQFVTVSELMAESAKPTIGQ